MAVSHVSNPALKTILPTSQWKGTPLDARGCFVNLERPFWPYLKDIIKWQLETNPYKAQKKKDTWQMPVIYDNQFLHSADNMLVWLGHSSFFMRINGVTLLTDPVFGNLGPMKRRSTLPLSPDVFTGLDYVLVSHNHRDHCDADSLQRIAMNNPKTTYLTGLGMTPLLQKLTGSSRIQEAGWYQQYQTEIHPIQIYYLPSQHWARRGLRDINTQLWGAYVIQAGGITIYFGGDTGYGGHLKEAGQIFPAIDYAIMGVGAFAPRWFMSPNHSDPNDAVRGFQEMGAKNLIPMHYGTFDLSDEPLGEPRRILEDMHQKGQINGALKLLDVGENFHLV